MDPHSSFGVFKPSQLAHFWKRFFENSVYLLKVAYSALFEISSCRLFPQVLAKARSGFQILVFTGRNDTIIRKKKPNFSKRCRKKRHNNLLRRRRPKSLKARNPKPPSPNSKLPNLFASSNIEQHSLRFGLPFGSPPFLEDRRLPIVCRGGQSRQQL